MYRIQCNVRHEQSSDTLGWKATRQRQSSRSRKYGMKPSKIEYAEIDRLIDKYVVIRWVTQYAMGFCMHANSTLP